MVILDSSFLVSFHNAQDSQHEIAGATMPRFLAGEWGRGLLSEYVVLETATVMATRVGSEKAVEVADLLLESEQLEYVPSSDLFVETLSTFRDLSASGLSFVDCALVVLARQRGIESILSFDRGFDAVEGIRRLPEPA